MTLHSEPWTPLKYCSIKVSEVVYQALWPFRYHPFLENLGVLNLPQIFFSRYACHASRAGCISLVWKPPEVFSILACRQPSSAHQLHLNKIWPANRGVPWNPDWLRWSHIRLKENIYCNPYWTKFKSILVPFDIVDHNVVSYIYTNTVDGLHSAFLCTCQYDKPSNKSFFIAAHLAILHLIIPYLVFTGRFSRHPSHCLRANPSKEILFHPQCFFSVPTSPFTCVNSFQLFGNDLLEKGCQEE